MYYEDALEMFEASKVLEAQKALLDIKCISYTKMKDDARKKLVRDLRKVAEPVHLREGISFDELFERIKNG